MKRNKILNLILISTAIVLTISITKVVVRSSGNNSGEKEVVKTIAKNKNIFSNQSAQDVDKESKSMLNIENLEFDNKSSEIVTKAGFVRDYYEKDDELYVIFDEVEFFRGEDARKEFLKDNSNKKSEEEWGNDYYIRNNDTTTKVYKVSKNSKLELLSFEAGKDNSIDLVTVTADKVKEKVDKHKGNKDLERGLLFNIDESNDVILGMRSIFTP